MSLYLLIFDQKIPLTRPPYFDILVFILTTPRDCRLILIEKAILSWLEVALRCEIGLWLRLRQDSIQMIDTIRSIVHVMQSSLLQLIIKRHVEPRIVGASQRSRLLEPLLEHLKSPDGV